ncbi:MAG: hypothetical protein J7484_01055 [Microbacterium sp.]|nr:hypothetical protein [Microbacterium sp.]
MMWAATFFDGEEWRDGTLVEHDGRMLVRDEPPAPGLPRLDGAVIGGFTDHHVHLQLVDASLLDGSRLGRVVDLGANPAVLRSYVGDGRFDSLRSLNDREDPRSLSEERSDETKRPFPTTSDRGHDARFDSLRSLNDRESPRSLSEERSDETKRPFHTTTAHGRFDSLRSLNDREAARSDERKRPFRTSTVVEYAGAFLTPVGGYPSDRSWAPAGSVREIATTADAASAVAEMADAGAPCIKVASNSTAGPVFDDDLFRMIVELAGRRGLPVVAHAEGAGEAQRAARLGATALAHTPFTEHLTDEEIAEQAASVSWISTLAIHGDPERTTAIDNARRFVAAGGTLHYGTDMGNGPSPVDLNAAELSALREAGLDGIPLLRALAPADPRDPASLLLLLSRETSDPFDARPLKV